MQTSNLLARWWRDRLAGSADGYGKSWGWLASTFAVSLAPDAASRKPSGNGMRRSGRPSRPVRRTGTWPGWLACRISGSRRSWLGSSVVVALVFAASAAAGGQPVTWTRSDMTAAAKAFGYPKPHPRTLSCRGLGAAVNGRYASFRCTAAYRHHIRRRFVMAGRGEGGWVCAGRTVTACTLLRHGFVSTSEAARYYGLSGYTRLSSIGYVQNKYRVASPSSSSSCAPAGVNTWSCAYTNPAATVTIAYKAVRGGWLISGSG